MNSYGIKDKKQINECVVEGYAKKEEDKYVIKELNFKNILNLTDTLTFTEVGEYAYNVIKAYFEKNYPEQKIIKDVNEIIEARYFKDIIIVKIKYTEKTAGGLFEEVTKSGYILKDSSGAYADVYID